MARLITLVFATIIALALVWDTSSALAIGSRRLNLSPQSVLGCIAATGFVGAAKAIGEIQKDCEHLGRGFRFSSCALGKLAMIGPEYLECIFPPADM